MSKVKSWIALALVLVPMLMPLIQAQVFAAEFVEEMPTVYVDPQSASAALGMIFNVSVRIFNLTNSFYQAREPWVPGQPLPPVGSLYNYSLGNMYGFNISFSWNPTALEYVSRSIRTPWEDYPDGVLHGPIWEMQDSVNSSAGTYSIAQQSLLYPVAGFNCPNRSATVFTMTFRVRDWRSSPLRLDSVELILHPQLATEPLVNEIIPHAVQNSVFSPAQTARIASMDVGALVGTQFYDPLIMGEDVTLHVLMTNNGVTTDSFNLTLYCGAIILATWEGESLPWGERRAYTYAFNTTNLENGVHTVRAEAKIAHNKTSISDSIGDSFTIIIAPVVSVSRQPNIITRNDTVTLSAEGSYHQYPNSSILKFAWSIYKHNATIPAYEYEGISVTHTFAENGTWRVVLVVEDNWGMTYDSLRTASTPYRKEVVLEVGSEDTSPAGYVLTNEQIAVLIGGLIVVMVFVFAYLARKERRELYEAGP